MRKRQHAHRAYKRWIIVSNLMLINYCLRATYFVFQSHFVLWFSQKFLRWFHLSRHADYRHIWFSRQMSKSQIYKTTSLYSCKIFSTSQLNILDVVAWYTASQLLAAFETESQFEDKYARRDEHESRPHIFSKTIVYHFGTHCRILCCNIM